MSDRNDLPVCTACGWHALRFAGHECNPALGKAADDLAVRIAVPSTKLGYGADRLTFSVDGDLVVGLDVMHPWNDEGDERDASKVEFQWRYLSCLGGLTAADAEDLITSLDAWRSRCRARDGGAS